MPLNYIATDNTTVVDGAGEASLWSEGAATDHNVYVLAVDITDLAGAEALIVRTYVDINILVPGTAHLLSEVTLTSGTDPDVYLSPPFAVTSGLAAEITVEDVGFAANRTVTWLLRQVM